MIKIKKLEEKQDVYDIQVPETSCFYANNILVHNCEIYQFTDEDTTAICTLSSMVIKNFVIDGKFDFNLLYNETRRVTRALNKVIDINNYSTEKGRKGGLEQRFISLLLQKVMNCVKPENTDHILTLKGHQCPKGYSNLICGV